jgi:hypothetical protein
MAGHYGKGYPARLKGVKTGRTVAAMAALQAFHDLPSRVPDAAGLRKDPSGVAPCSCLGDLGAAGHLDAFRLHRGLAYVHRGCEARRRASALRSQAAAAEADVMKLTVAHDTPSEG